MPEQAKRDEKLEALLGQLEEGTKAVFQSDNYKAMLTTIAKFHRYSLNNQILIAAQKPEATLVAGFRAWQQKFNRRVVKGEHGIRIIGYTPKTVTTQEPKLDPQGNPVYDPQGRPVMEQVQSEIPAFKVMYVFDVSQTEGEPLPALEMKELEGNVQRFEVMRDTLLSLSPVPVVFESFPGDARGMMDYSTNRITVQPDMSQTQTIKTLIHEIAHAQMHGKDVKLTREVKETEAESVAYILCQHLGIDSGSYSFPYLASWSNGQDVKVLQASLNRIREQAKQNMDAIDHALSHLPEQIQAQHPELSPQDASTLSEVLLAHAQRNREAAADRPSRFSDWLTHAERQAEQANTRRMAGGRGPLVQETELRRRN